MASVTEIVRRRHKRQARRRVEQGRRRLWTALLGIALLVLVVLPGGAALGGAAVMYWQAVQNLPAPGETPSTGGAPTEFYDSSGATEVYTLKNPLGESGSWMALDSLPPYLVSATLAAEDPGFLTRSSFNPLQTLVDLWTNSLIGTLPPDPSITGRLVRSVIAPLADFHGSANDARAQEIALIAEINRRYTPRQILEWHLNTDYYGNEAYGIEAAAKIYLNKDATSLTLDEAALLAAIPTAPQYNPFSDETAARGRQSDLLGEMRNLEHGHAGRLRHGVQNQHDDQPGQLPAAGCAGVHGLRPPASRAHPRLAWLRRLPVDRTRQPQDHDLARPRSLQSDGLRAASAACAAGYRHGAG